VLVVFRGVQGYISPNWYPGKHETHRRVPTWNYEVVHAHGTIHVRDDEKFVRGVVARLTRQHEADQAEPWKMGDAPADYIAEQLSHIVGHRGPAKPPGGQAQAEPAPPTSGSRGCHSRSGFTRQSSAGSGDEGSAPQASS